jgi:hypothetical protein
MIQRPTFVLVFGCLLAGLLSSCTHQSAVHSSLSTTIGGREVKASTDAPASISQQNGAAVLSFQGHKLIVERERVLLDANEIGKVASDSKKVDVFYTEGKLTVAVDGKPAIDVSVP